MQTNEIIQIVGEKVGFRDDLNDLILRYMQLVHQSKLMVQPFPSFLQARLPVTALATVQAIDLPADFLCFSEEWKRDGVFIDTGAVQEIVLPNLGPFGGSWKKLTPVDVSSVISYQAAPPGRPEYFARDAGQLLLLPTPDVDYSLEILYTKQDALPTFGNTNLWLTYAPDMVLGETLIEVARTLKQDDSEGKDLVARAGDRIARLYGFADAFDGKPLTIGMLR